MILEQVQKAKDWDEYVEEHSLNLSDQITTLARIFQTTITITPFHKKQGGIQRLWYKAAAARDDIALDPIECSSRNEAEALDRLAKRLFGKQRKAKPEPKEQGGLFGEV